MTGLRVGQVAEAAGVNIETLRYYERRGLISQPDRSLGGHRVYPESAVTTLRVIKTAQRLGFSLREVAELLEFATSLRHRSGAGLQSRAVAKVAEIDARIAELQEIRATLSAAIEAGCDDLIECAGSECCPLPFAGEAVRRS